MASEETVVAALKSYLSALKNPQDNLVLSADFDTEDIRARIRRGRERWFFAISEEVYFLLQDDVFAVEEFFRTMDVFKRMQGTSIDRAFWIVTDDGKVTGKYAPIQPTD